jgi:hypothetical protein
MKMAEASKKGKLKPGATQNLEPWNISPKHVTLNPEP